MRQVYRLVLIVSLLLVGIANLQVAAQGGAPCMDRQPENNDPGTGCKPWIFFNLDKLRIRTPYDFVWIRSEAASNASVVAKVYRKPYNTVQVDYLSAPDGITVKWDGFQWWWFVRSLYGKPARGWVEQAALVKDGYGSRYVRGLAAWGTPALAKVRRGITAKIFGTSSLSNEPQDILQADTPITLLASESVWEEPQWITNTSRWLWRIQYETPSGTKIGWIEQNTVTFLKRQ